MPKRKVKGAAEETVLEEPRRSSRRVSNNVTTSSGTPKPPLKKAKKTQTKEKGHVAETPSGEGKELAEAKPSSPDISTRPSATTPKNDEAPTGRQYWLMKAEPESRLERGKDIKFSIDDLASKTDPEPWDGIRAYPARNNLRAMRKGDLAFFYHSSCKVPAIVGIMEIVQEHSPDVSAHDPSAPYFDASSTPENPKWSVVHVEFRQKLKTPITLKELKAWQGEKGHVLAEMQMLKLARISVSKVREDEWRFLVSEMEKNGDIIKE